MILIKENEMSIFDRYKYVKSLEVKEEYQRNGYEHNFYELLNSKHDENEYMYLSVYYKTIEKESNIYYISIQERISNGYRLTIRLKGSIKDFEIFKDFPTNEEIEKFINEFFEVER